MQEGGIFIVGRAYTRTASERARLVAEQQSSGMTQIAWCKERGISRRTLGRWILGVKVSEIQSDSTADWVELNDCNPISSVSSGLHEAIEILVGKYAICVKPGFDREAMLDVCRILGEIC